jgi:hypothetical protein
MSGLGDSGNAGVAVDGVTSGVIQARQRTVGFGHPWARTVSEPYLYLLVPPLNLAVGSADTFWRGRRILTKRLMTSAVAAVAHLAAGATYVVASRHHSAVA